MLKNLIVVTTLVSAFGLTLNEQATASFWFSQENETYMPVEINPNDIGSGWDWIDHGDEETDPWDWRPEPDLTIGEDKFRKFGLDNWFVPWNTKKMVFEFDFVGGSFELGALESGIHIARTYSDGIETSVPVVSNVNGHVKIEWTLTPSPDWETIQIYNRGPGVMTMNNISFTFTKVPAPGAMALLGMGMITTRRRRK